MSGTTRTASHAPSANLETTTTTSVIPVADRAERVDPERVPRLRPADAAPVLHHPGLRQREREERADREEGDEPIGDAAEDDEQDAREEREHDDAVREDEPPAAHREGVGEEAVEREDAAEAREVGEAGVRGEREHGDDRGDRDVVEGAAPDHRAGQLGEDALVARRRPARSRRCRRRGQRSAMPARSATRIAMMIGERPLRHCGSSAP